MGAYLQVVSLVHLLAQYLSVNFQEGIHLFMQKLSSCTQFISYRGRRSHLYLKLLHIGCFSSLSRIHSRCLQCNSPFIHHVNSSKGDKWNTRKLQPTFSLFWMLFQLFFCLHSSENNRRHYRRKLLANFVWIHLNNFGDSNNRTSFCFSLLNT